MKNIYSLFSVIFLVISCNSIHTHNYTEVNCASMPYNQYRNVVIDHFISVVYNDTLVLNELKFECVNNAMYTKKAIYDKFGKWNEEIYPEGKTRPILVWENLTLFPNDLTKFTVAANGLEIFHTHPNPTLTNIVPMFSPEDVRYLAMVAAKHNTNGQPKDYSVYVITLTVPSGTYALKIEDPVKFFGFMNTKYGEFKDYLQDTYDISGNQASSSVLINDLLKVLQKYNVGVALYKANEDYSDWFKQGF